MSFESNYLTAMIAAMFGDFDYLYRQNNRFFMQERVKKHRCKVCGKSTDFDSKLCSKNCYLLYKNNSRLYEENK